MAKYHTGLIIKEIEERKRPKFIFFWGHQPAKDGSVSKSCFSQWWEQSFEVDGISYPSAEHWMMAEKARLFGDEERLKLILNCKSPAEAKKLGREVIDFDILVWNQYKYHIVVEGNWHKFSQNEDLKLFLIKTGNRVLVEASPYDQFWGIGMHANEEGIEDPYNWKGENLLGFALMEVRDRLNAKHLEQILRRD